MKDKKWLKDTVCGGELPVTTENRYLWISFFLCFSIRELEILCFYPFQEEFKKEAKDKGFLRFLMYHLKSIFLRDWPQPWLASSLHTSKKEKKKLKKNYYATENVWDLALSEGQIRKKTWSHCGVGNGFGLWRSAASAIEVMGWGLL